MFGRSIVLSVIGKGYRIELLAVLFDYPSRKFTINELAKTAGVPVMTAHRAVREFQRLGLVEIESIGKSFVVTLNKKSKLVESLKKLSLPDPFVDAAKKFAKEMSTTKGVEEIYLFGSVAKRKHKLTSDVDLAVIYNSEKITKKEIETKLSEAVSNILLTNAIRIVPLAITRRGMKTAAEREFMKSVYAGELIWKVTIKR